MSLISRLVNVALVVMVMLSFADAKDYKNPKIIELIGFWSSSDSLVVTENYDAYIFNPTHVSTGNERFTPYFAGNLKEKFRIKKLLTLPAWKSGNPNALGEDGNVYYFTLSAYNDDGTSADKLLLVAKKFQVAYKELLPYKQYAGECVIKMDDKVYCTDLFYKDLPIPKTDQGEEFSFKSISSDGYGSVTCGVTIDKGHIYCWRGGRYEAPFPYGERFELMQLGRVDAEHFSVQTRPQKFPVAATDGQDEFSSIVVYGSIDKFFLYVLDKKGRAYYNNGGTKEIDYLSKKTYQLKPVPDAVDGVNRYASIYSSECALTDEGRAYCWGGNASGSTGTGKIVRDDAGELTVEPRMVDRPVPLPKSTSGEELRFSRLWNDYPPCGLTKDGRVFCWGLLEGDHKSFEKHEGDSVGPRELALLTKTTEIKSTNN